MLAKDVKRILIAGGGMMGKNIAFVFTKNPAYQVGVYDMREVDVRAGIRQNTAELVAKGVLDPAELEERLSRVSFTTEEGGNTIVRGLPQSLYGLRRINAPDYTGEELLGRMRSEE